MEATEASQALVSARVNRAWITDAAGFPSSEKEGLAVQDAMISDSGELGKVVGWKVSSAILLFTLCRTGCSRPVRRMSTA